MRNLTKLREERGLSRRQLSLRAGLSENALSMAERRGSASPNTLKKLADALGVPTSEITGPPKEEPPNPRVVFLQSQYELARQALECLEGAEQAAEDGQLEYARRFFGLAKDSITHVVDGQRDALRLEMGGEAEESPELNDSKVKTPA